MPGATIKYERLDLSDLSSVRDCVKRVADGNVEYDVWINNAGSCLGAGPHGRCPPCSVRWRTGRV